MHRITVLRLTAASLIFLSIFCLLRINRVLSQRPQANNSLRTALKGCNRIEIQRIYAGMMHSPEPIYTLRGNDALKFTHSVQIESPISVSGTTIIPMNLIASYGIRCFQGKTLRCEIGYEPSSGKISSHEIEYSLLNGRSWKGGWHTLTPEASAYMSSLLNRMPVAKSKP